MTSTSIPTFPFDRPVPTEPSPMLSELRNSCPVAPIELPSGHTAWLVTRFDDVKECCPTSVSAAGRQRTRRRPRSCRSCSFAPAC